METVYFGSYPQGPNGEVEAIEWLVLDNSEDKILLLSKHALDCQPYNKNFEETSWEKCSLRFWLNNEFLNQAFSEDEKSQIVLSNILADKNPEYDTNQGIDTQDKIFLLSVLESQKYFNNDKDRVCWPTAYANKIGV